jgi:hypothetical protein
MGNLKNDPVLSLMEGEMGTRGNLISYAREGRTGLTDKWSGNLTPMLLWHGILCQGFTGEYWDSNRGYFSGVAREKGT